jgi:hypothetical protein
MKGLEQLVSSNIHEFTSGIPWILVGKAQSTRGYRYWDMVVLHEEESACEFEFRKAHILLEDDPNAILINGYHNAWVGVDEDGEYKSIKDIAKRIKAGYEAGWCKTSAFEVDMLKPAAMLIEYIRRSDENIPYMTEEERAEWLADRKQLITERKLPVAADIKEDFA